MSISQMQTIGSTTSSSSCVQARGDLCQEQEQAMKEWILSKMPNKLLPYFKNVKNAWDRTEVITACIKDLNYKDIVLKPTIDEFSDEVVYEPYFKLNTLASILGYSRPNDLYAKDKPLYSHNKYTITNLSSQLRHYGVTEETIIPAHLIDKSDSNRNNYIYINVSACEDLISAAMKQTKFKEKAKEFKDVLIASTKVSNAIIAKLNQLVAEYRYKTLEAEQERRKKQLEDDTKRLAMRRYPDIKLRKSHHGYIFSSPEYMANNLYKIGITDHLTKREGASKTYCPTGSFLHTVKIYDSRSAESMLHQALKAYKLDGGGEWFSIPSLDEAKKLLNMVANNINTLYEHISTYPSILRTGFGIGCNPSSPMIEDDLSLDTLIASYVNDVVAYLIDKKITCMSKTDLVQLLKKTACSNPKYKKERSQLPMDLETFMSNKNIKGIMLTKKPINSSMRIKVEYIPIA